MKPLVDTLSVLEENTDYWADREISKIPPFLLRRWLVTLWDRRKEIPISLIMPESVLKRWVEDYREQTDQFLKMENAKLFVCTDCERTPAIVAADNFMTMALFPKNTVFDRKYVISFEPGALAWGKELYDYYEQRSEQIHDIDNYTHAPDRIKREI